MSDLQPSAENQVVMRPLNRNDAAQGYALSCEAGWNQNEADWRFLLETCRGYGVLASMVLSLLAYVARAYRWKILLSAADQQVSTFRLTLAVFIGYLANLAFPRLGEITRCAVLKKTNGIPIGLTLGTVVTERNTL